MRQTFLLVTISIVFVVTGREAIATDTSEATSSDCRFFKPIYDKFWDAYMALPDFYYYPPGDPLAFENPKGRRAYIKPSARLAAGWEATRPTPQDWKLVLEHGTNKWKLVKRKPLRDAMQGMTSGRTYTEAVVKGYWVSNFKKAMSFCGLRNQYSDKYLTQKNID